MVKCRQEGRFAMLCTLCPRNCGVDRKYARGVCREGENVRVAKVMLHHFEEPCISGGEHGVGSGAIFFSGCSLRCVFCQNRDISREGYGEIYTARRLADEMLRLEERGAYNINLVTPTHFTDKIKEALDLAKGRLTIPVAWNTSGYEKPETVRGLAGYVDIFLADFKYSSPELSAKYSFAPDYAKYASAALCEMVKITGSPVIEGGFMKRGTIVRHLVLPGAYRDSIAVLDLIDKTVGHEKVLLSLMAQYTPDFLDGGHAELARCITTFEYKKVLGAADAIGFDGYSQERESSSASYTPDFRKEDK